MGFLALMVNEAYIALEDEDDDDEWRRAHHDFQ
jgi:hypothetical protein